MDYIRSFFTFRCDNWTGPDGFGFGLDGSDQFDLLEEIRSESDRVGSIYMLYFSHLL
jgi:hypothetical protein